jgi:hypothetical protein
MCRKKPEKLRIRGLQPIIKKGRNSTHLLKNKNGIIMCTKRTIGNRDRKPIKRGQINIRL